jgi:Protein of unknown function (DUF3102)
MTKKKEPKKAQKKSKAIEPTEIDKINDVLDEDAKKIKKELKLKNLEQDAELVEKRFGDGVEYDFERIMLKAQSAKQLLADSFIELGRCLLRIKAQETQGQFLKALERVGVAQSTAYRYMTVAVKFGDTQNLKALPLRKLDVLGQLTEGEIKDLDKKGKLGSITADELDRMNAEDLRKLVRKERGRELKRRKNGEQQYFQVKQELDSLKSNSGTSVEFDRTTAAIFRGMTKLLEMELSDVDVEGLDKFILLMTKSMTRMKKRAHPEKLEDMPDEDIERGKLEAEDRDKSKN